MKSIISILFLIGLLCSMYPKCIGKPVFKDEKKIKLKKDKIQTDKKLEKLPVLYTQIDTTEVISFDEKSKDFTSDDLMKFYPKPKKGVIYIKFKKELKGMAPVFELYDYKGWGIKKAKINGEVAVMNLRHLRSGFYKFIVRQNTDIIKTYEIEKE